MSVTFCRAAEHGMHNFQRSGRTMACRWCGLTREQMRQQAIEEGRANLKNAHAAVTLTPEQIAEADKLRPYQQRRKRFMECHAATCNLAAWNFDNLPAPTRRPETAVIQVAKAMQALEAAVAAVSNPEVREMLYLAQMICIEQRLHMGRLLTEYNQRAERAPLPATEPAGAGGEQVAA